MNTLDRLTEEFQRQKLAEILGQCTPEQQEFFNIRVFPNGVPSDKLSSAYDLCERTIQKNMADRS